MSKNVIIATLVAVIAVGGAIGAFAATRTVDTTARVEVTVWQSVSDGSLYLSTRPEGGRWTTHQTPLDMSRLSTSGRFRQGSAITVGVPVRVTVDVPNPTPAPTRTAATPTPAPTQGGSGFTVSGVGNEVKTVTLGAGLKVCTVEFDNNYTTYSDGSRQGRYFSATIYGNLGYLTSRLLASDIAGSGRIQKVLERVNGGTYRVEVEATGSAPTWTVSCE